MENGGTDSVSDSGSDTEPTEPSTTETVSHYIEEDE